MTVENMLRTPPPPPLCYFVQVEALHSVKNWREWKIPGWNQNIATKLASASHILMSSGCAHPVDHCMCAHLVDHWMCAPSGPLDVCICSTTTCKHPRAHRKHYIPWSTRCSYIWWTTSSPLVVIRMQRHLVDHRMCKSPVYIHTLTR